MTTLKDALKEFPRNAEHVIFDNIGDNFYELDYYHKIRLQNSSKSIVVISVKEETLFCGLKITTVVRSGKNIYLKNEWRDVIIVENNKVKSNCKDIEVIRFLFASAKRRIAGDLSTEELTSYACKSYMIKAILTNKVYSIETFYKELLSKSYKIKNFNWRLMRQYINSPILYRVSFLDLKLFTKSLEKSLTTLCSAKHDSLLIYDLLNSAIKLDEVVDLTWSEKRMQLEHSRQIKKLSEREIENLSTYKVYDTTNLDTLTIKLVNTELDLYLEGKTMNHCVYNYWNSVRNHRYMVFHMNAPENCTFSCKLISGDVVIDQIHLAYNQSVASTTEKLAFEYLEEHYDTIKCLLQDTNEFLPNIF